MELILVVVSSLAAGLVSYSFANRYFQRSLSLRREQATETGEKLTHAVDAAIVEAREAPPQDVEVGRAEESESALSAGVVLLDKSDVDALKAAIVEATESSSDDDGGRSARATSIIVGLIAAVGLIVATIFGAWIGRSDDPPDCTAYVTTLLAVREQAPSNEAAVAAVNSLEWGSFDDDCGSPALFIGPLGDYTPPAGG